MFRNIIRLNSYTRRTEVFFSKSTERFKQCLYISANAKALCTLPRFSFTSANDNIGGLNSEPNDSSPKDESRQTIDSEKVEEVKEDFIEYMKREPSNEEMIYEYNKKTLFRFDPDMQEQKGRKRLHWSLAGIFSGAAYLTYLYINPWVALAPGALAFAALLTLRFSSTFDKKTVHKIEIVDNYHIKVYPIGSNEKDIICDIQETELFGVQILPKSSGQKDDEPNSYLLSVNFRDAIKGKQHHDMNLFFDPILTTYDNIDLIKCILYGQVQHIPKFRYIGPTHQSSIIEDILAEKMNQKSNSNIRLDVEDDEFAFFRKKWVEEEEDDSSKSTKFK